jgi:hypothetical protein
MLDPSGAQVFWDYQIGTFTGFIGQFKVGRYGGEILTVNALETSLGVILAAQTGADLQEAMLAHPWLGGKRFVTKLQFRKLFRPNDLEKIYDVVRSSDPLYKVLSIKVQIEMENVNAASEDRVDLSDPDTLSGLLKMEQYQLITAGDAQRIAKGLPWQL